MDLLCSFSCSIPGSTHASLELLIIYWLYILDYIIYVFFSSLANSAAPYIVVQICVRMYKNFSRVYTKRENWWLLGDAHFNGTPDCQVDILFIFFLMFLPQEFEMVSHCCLNLHFLAFCKLLVILSCPFLLVVCWVFFWVVFLYWLIFKRFVWILDSDS